MVPGMVSVEEARRLDERAKERAEQVAPYPKRAPGEVGIVGAIICFAAVSVFSLIAGLESERYETAIAWTSIVGFLAPYLYLKNQQRLHYKAYGEAYSRLQTESAKPPV